MGDPAGSLHGLTAGEARTLGLPLEELEELLRSVGVIMDEEDFMQEAPSVSNKIIVHELE